MNCPIRSEETAEILLAYTARRLDAVKTAMLEDHMSVCSECAAFRAGQDAVWQALDAWEAPPVAADFNRRLYQRIEADAAAPWYKRLFHTPIAMWKPMVPLAAACLVVVAGFVLDHPIAMQSPSTSTPIHLTVPQAEQVENALDDLQLLHQLDSNANSGASESM